MSNIFGGLTSEEFQRMKDAPLSDCGQTKKRMMDLAKSRKGKNAPAEEVVSVYAFSPENDGRSHQG